MFRCLSFRLLVVTLSVVCLPTSSLRSQSVEFEHISIEQGLSQSVVTSILQDNKGFMWFGTQDGLNKYDGYTFTVYRYDPSDSNSLSDNYIRSIFEDDAGVLWVGTNGGGLSRFDRDREQFTNYVHDPRQPYSLSGNRVNSICEDRSGELWIGTDHGLNRFDRDTRQFTRFVHDPHDPHSLSDDNVRVVYEDRDGRLWIGTEAGGLNMLDPETWRFLHFGHVPGDPHSLSSNNILSLYEDRAGALWVGTDGGGLNKRMPSSRLGNESDGSDSSQERFTRFVHDPTNPGGLNNNTVMSIVEDHAGGLWVGTYGGGVSKMLSPKSGPARFVHYVNNPIHRGSLSANAVWCLYEDRSGTLWIGTQGGGLNRLDQNREQFAHILVAPEVPNSIGQNAVNSIYEDPLISGTLWVGTDKGLYRLSGDRDRTTAGFVVRREPLGHVSAFVRPIHRDRSGVLWVGTDGDGLCRYDEDRASFTRYSHDPQNPYSINSDRIMSIFEDRSGTLWFGTAGGLVRFDRATGRFKRYMHDPGDPNSLSYNSVWSITEARTGALWIGTAGGGLNRLLLHQGVPPDPREAHFERYLHDPRNPASLSHDVVLSIHEDRSGTLWIGTSGGGLDALEPDGQQGSSATFVHYTTKDGLPNDVVYGVLEDTSGCLWLSTNKGLSRFDPQAKTFKNYDATDGLQSNEFTFGAYDRGESGRMYFGGINGITAFFPERIQPNTYVPPIVITSIRLLDRPVQRNREINELREIRLSSDENFFGFEFASLSYTNPKKNRYAYKLEGFDSDWIYCGTRRYASYMNLDPGEYVFRVKGSNNDGVWNEEGTYVRVIITPPWWKEWWAYIIYLMAIAAFLYGARRYELNRIRLKNRLQFERVEADKLRELDHLKSRFFANISHEFRTPLTLILGQIDSVHASISERRLRNRLRMAERNARRLQMLIDQLLDLSKLEAGEMRLRAKKSDFARFMRNLVSGFEPLALQKHISLEFYVQHSGGSGPSNGMEVTFDREKMEKVFLNLLSNAFKFTPDGGTISVRVRLRQGGATYSADESDAGGAAKGRIVPQSPHVEVSIKDSGIGIPSDQLARIFDRFYRVGETQGGDLVGTGIGLALVKELVDLHHGQINVFSETGVGTEFIVRIPLGQELLGGDVAEEVVDGFEAERPSPLVETEPPLEADVDDHTNRPSKGSGEVVLLVEDNGDVRTYIREHLEKDFRIIEARTGEEGLALALQTIPDLLITDVMMPEMDGYEFARRVRADEKTSHIPIIMLTARAAEEDKLEGLHTGVDDYLTKPFNPRELSARVRNLIELRRRLRRRFSNATTIKPSEVTATSIDQLFLQRVIASIEAHVGDEDFGVQLLADEVSMSVSQLNRKLNALIGQAAGQLIRSMRLQRAADLLNQNAGTIAEIAYQVGFSDQAHFARSFKKQFGCSPSAFRERGSAPPALPP